jgi:GT2 family glycosyltransferase
MPVSAIISNLNGAAFLPRLLESLQGQQDTQVEIIVVDRESKDDSHAILGRHPHVRVISEPPQSGLVSGYARGVAEASHQHLFFCNEDMWFDPQCLARLERQIDLPARIAAADPWQWSYDGKTWIHGITRFKKCRWAMNGVHPFYTVDFMVAGADGDIVPVACAGAFLMHRQVYDEVGGWDKSFFLDYEDADLFTRVWQRGWKCVAVPSAKVYHAVGMSNFQATGNQHRVGRKRYISSRLARPVIIWKYFSASHLWMAFGVFLITIANNLAKGRFKIVIWDLTVLFTFLSRFASIQAFRRDNREFNRRNPGERFFRQPQFQV